MKLEVFEPYLNKDHDYAVCVPIPGESVVPVRSYRTVLELEEGLRQFYQMAKEKGIILPIAVEKATKGSDWNNTGGVILRGLVQKVAKELAQLR